MTKSTFAALFAAGLTMTSVSLHAQIAEIKWNEAGHAAQEFQVQPEKFAEWCGKLRSGDKVKWGFEAAGPVNFNIHYHEGKDVRFPAKQDAIATAEGTLDVSIDQDYCWMWSNKSSAPVTVKVHVSKTR